MAAISNSFDMFFRAHDYASRVIGNINVSMATQLGTFVQMGQKIPMVSRQVSAAMVATSQSTERYIRDLIEMQKYTKLNTQSAAAMQQALEQTGGNTGDLVELTDQLWEANTKAYKMESQLFLARMRQYGVITDTNGALKDNNKFMEAVVKTLSQYKEGIDRARASEKIFGDAKYALLVANAKERLIIEERITQNEKYRRSLEKNKIYMMDNRLALLDLTVTFKQLGSDISEIVLPVLTVLIKSFDYTIRIVKFLLSPIIAVLKVFASGIAYLKEWATALGIVGKIILWVAVFAIGFFIRAMLLVIALKVVRSIRSYGGAFRKLGKAIWWCSKMLIGFNFAGQDMVVNAKSYVRALKGVGRAFWGVSKAALRAGWSMLIFAAKALLVIAVGLIVYELFLKILKLFTWISELIASGLGFDDAAQSMRDFQRDLDDASLSSAWDRIVNKMGAVNEKAKEGTKEMKDSYDMSRMLYDSLGDSLERAINLPAASIPALAERMKLNKQYMETVSRASIEMQRAAREGMRSAPTTTLDIGSQVGGNKQPTNIEVNIDKNALNEWYARQTAGG